MAEHVRFELVSPEKLVLETEAALVTVPGEEGEFGVLPGHAPVVSGLRPGLVSICETNDSHVDRRIFVPGGFAEVNGDRLTILAEAAIDPEGVDPARLAQDIRDAEDDLNDSDDAHERSRLEARLIWMRQLQDIVTA